ncbi:MAG: SMC family ATPase, partial [Actinomycetota bacterium]|nr:SMC family ATPase [Actinomycetota bacterium]
ATAVSRLTDQLRSQLRARAPLQDAFATVDNLSRLADGTNTENRLRMRLSYFVLSARLEQVAAAASERLLRMTDGRFSLVHSDDRAAGNQRSGLGLAVCDAWYGTTRDPATLSGGESFMASLALALGLADVVVAEAGGAFMDTLFVDEGFGSLDESTLDAVLDVLDGLREGGRAVGLVSHVGELRQRVPTQLAVRRGRTGSTLTLSA